MSRVESFLRERHADAPGMTSHAFGHGSDARGRSSYSRLADLVPTHGEPSVLDVACGDGHLLEHVRRRNEASSFFGIDLSADELTLARERLPQAELIEGRAQELPWSTESMDLVLSHMALMLFDHVEDVLTEIARVLRPGGTFSAVVGSPECPNEVLATYRRLWTEVARTNDVKGIEIGDERTREPSSLERLVSDTGRFESISTELFELRLNGSPEDAWAGFRNNYNHAWLSAEQLAELRRDFVDEIHPLARADGRVEYGWTFLQVIATRG